MRWFVNMANMKCVNCGREALEGITFCPRCLAEKLPRRAEKHLRTLVGVSQRVLVYDELSYDILNRLKRPFRVNKLSSLEECLSEIKKSKRGEKWDVLLIPLSADVLFSEFLRGLSEEGALNTKSESRLLKGLLTAGFKVKGTRVLSALEPCTTKELTHYARIKGIEMPRLIGYEEALLIAEETNKEDGNAVKRFVAEITDTISGSSNAAYKFIEKTREIVNEQSKNQHKNKGD